MTKKLDKAADRIQAEWLAHPTPSPYSSRDERTQAYTESLVRELVDLLRDNIR